MATSIFFRPPIGWVGDVIPFQSDGLFKLFYLHEIREEPKQGTSWNLVSTSDLTTFADNGVSLEHGDSSSADFNIYTGSVVLEGSTHHVFFTGQNPTHLGSDALPLQLVMHASSSNNMATWTKHPEHTFGAPSGYETGDWRDPFVFYDEKQGFWRMLLAARHKDGPERRRGVIAQMTSSDLVDWKLSEPFWDPRRYITHECPEVFQWGEWWYLVFSEFSEAFTTRYRMAKSLDGPWLVPQHDTIDGRAFYAAKSASRDGRRFFFGWIASKEGDHDDGDWQWAGAMSILEARQSVDGALEFMLPLELIERFGQRVSLAPIFPVPVQLRAPDGYLSMVSEAELPSQVYIRADFDIASGTTECGLLLRATENGDESYILRLEPKRSRIVFDRWPREATGGMQWQVSGDVPYAIELERACDLAPGSHTLEVVMDGDICVAVVDKRVALSARIYDHTAGRLGVFVGEGESILRDLQVLIQADN